MKKYILVNSNSNQNKDCKIFYIIYTILILVVVYILYKIYSFTFFSENFDTSTTISNLTPEQLMTELQSKNEQLNSMKNKLENKLEEQSKAIYLNQNFDKVDESSFNDEINFLTLEFNNTDLSQIDLSTFNVIDTSAKFNNIINEAHAFKNLYNPGDIVNTKSSFNISPDDICYRSNGKQIKSDSNFVKNYPDCMVCKVDDATNIYDSNSWKNTKTNINQVCLFNTNADANSGIPNMQQCRKLCNVKN